MVFIEERFILQTVYVLKIEILHFFKPKIRGLYSRAENDQDRVIMARVRWSSGKSLIVTDFASYAPVVFFITNQGKN